MYGSSLMNRRRRGRLCRSPCEVRGPLVGLCTLDISPATASRPSSGISSEGCIHRIVLAALLDVAAVFGESRATGLQLPPPDRSFRAFSWSTCWRRICSSGFLPAPGPRVSEARA